MNLFRKKQSAAVTSANGDAPAADFEDHLANTPKNQWAKIWPVLACGSGLFAEGYVQSVIGSVGTILGLIYGKAYTKAPARANVAAISFAGTVLGQLIFGYTADKWSRRNSLLVSTIILIIFAALSAGSYGGGTLNGMVTALTVYRFFLGIGIGGEYPAGSVSAAEASGELKSGTRNFWFIMFTNVAIDWGFVIGAFVPYVLVLIFTTNHLRAAWRVALGLGVIPPIALLLIRLKLQEPEEFKRESMKHTKIPYGLVLRFYWKRLLVVGAIWFLYDFSSYSFGIYSSTIVTVIIGDSASLATSFGWNTVINLFYVPGAMLGGPFSDWLGPRWALTIGVTLQAVVGFIMAGLYPHLAQASHIGAFAVVYGLFLSLGEFGPGDNIGLIASKTSATGIRGQYYGIAAAIGKVGAFVGTYVFPHIIDAAGGDEVKGAQYPFYVSSALCVLTAILAIFFLPHIGQDTIVREDIRFREYLESKGWDTTQLGLAPGEGGALGRGSEEYMEKEDVKQPIGGVN